MTTCSCHVTFSYSLFIYFAAAAVDAPCPVTLFLATVPSRNPFLRTQHAVFNLACTYKCTSTLSHMHYMHVCKINSHASNIVMVQVTDIDKKYINMPIFPHSVNLVDKKVL